MRVVGGSKVVFGREVAPKGESRQRFCDQFPCFFRGRVLSPLIVKDVSSGSICFVNMYIPMFFW